MKILHLLPYNPVPANFGGALRIYHILKHLTRHHDVTVAGFGYIGDLEKFYQEFPTLKGKTHFIEHPWRIKFRRFIQLYSLFSRHSFWYNAVTTRLMQQTINDILARQDFDIIQSEFPSMAFFNLDSNALKIYDAHNVEHETFRRMSDKDPSKIRRIFYRSEYHKLYKEELEVCRSRDAIFTTSQPDKELFHNDVPDIPKFVIPNGVDTTYFHPGTDKSEANSLVFVGMMGYIPNHDAMMYFLDEIFPRIKASRPSVKLFIVGKAARTELKNRASENVIVTDFVEDVRPFVWRSSVYVVPLRMGGGTRLKIMEALAMKKPMVTTSIGCEGIDLVDGESALIADDPVVFSNRVIQLLNDMSLQEQISSRGYKLVKEKYEWNKIGQSMEHAYEILRHVKRIDEMPNQFIFLQKNISIPTYLN